jgi:hypothetical protein
VPVWGDSVATVVTLIVFVLGVWAAFQYNWLLERYRAEQCRLARYRFLIRWAAAGGITPAVKDWAEAELGRIRGLQAASLRDYVKRMPPLDDLPVLPDGQLDPEAVAQLVSYYRSRRLRGQKEFFERRAFQHEHPYRRFHRLMVILLLSSLGLALFHFVLHLVDRLQGHEPAGLTFESKVLIVLAVSLPILNTALRTYASANEPGRNSIRYLAAAGARD